MFRRQEELRPASQQVFRAQCPASAFRFRPAKPIPIAVRDLGQTSANDGPRIKYSARSEQPASVGWSRQHSVGPSNEQAFSQIRLRSTADRIGRISNPRYFRLRVPYHIQRGHVRRDKTPGFNDEARSAQTIACDAADATNIIFSRDQR